MAVPSDPDVAKSLKGLLSRKFIVTAIASTALFIVHEYALFATVVLGYQGLNVADHVLGGKDSE